MKNKKILIGLFMIVGLISFAYVGTKVSSFNNRNNTNNYNINTEILGIWVLENDSTTKIEFLSNGILKKYEDNQLVETNSYDISHNCEDEVLTNEWFLKTTDEDNYINCDIINGINDNNSGILSLTSGNQGKLIIYIRP